MNDAHPTLKFTFEISDNIVTYLDLQIFKGNTLFESGVLDHKINMKKTETHQWLCPESAHCPPVFSALILGETIRYCRGHTSEQDFIDKVNFFTEKLVDRGYNRAQVNEITNKVKFNDHDTYLSNPKMKNKVARNAIPLVLVTTYTPYTRTHDLKTALLKHWNKIEQNCTLRKLFPNPPLLAYKRAENLADMLVNSKLPSLEGRPDIKGSSITLDTPRESAGLPFEPASLTAKSNQVVLDQSDLDLVQCLIDLMDE